MNQLQKAFEELRKEEELKRKKKKPILSLPKEKRLQYYSGWLTKDKPATSDEKVEKQRKLV